ncbi:MAG: efflux RND transporter periplasmic adaptor subunit [Kineosporiaceae bacterium]|nr:efflux RND transporter periplasmic adaptor subunit [Kineosporiaceae bacterium]
MSTRLPSRLPTLITVFVLAAGGLSGCTNDQPTGIEVGAVERATVTEVVEAPATFTARASASVSSPAAATVVSLTVRDGQRVSAGQELLRLESPSARSTLQQAEQADAAASASGRVSLPRVDLSLVDQADRTADAAFAQTSKAADALPEGALRSATLAQLAAARADHAAAQRAARQTIGQLNAGLGSLGRLAASLAQAQRAQTRAAVIAAQAAVEALTVRAPISGTVTFGGAAPSGTNSGASGGSAGTDLSAALDQVPSSLRAQAQSLVGGSAGSNASIVTDLAVGTPVSAGSALLTVTDVSELGLSASIDETDVVMVRVGVTAEIELDALPGMRYPAVVRSVDLQPTTSARGGVTYQVRLRLDPAGPSRTGLRPGMSAVARLNVRTAEQAISVPAAAVFRDESGDAVWLVNDGVAQRRPVTLGAQGAERIEIVKGLAVGDRVVIRGADKVGAGQRVTP